MNSASVLFLIGFISLVQFGTPAATASQESWLLISDLLKSDFEFPSGFQRQSDCSDMLSPESHLKRIVAQPDAEFRELSSKDKIRQVHLIADILSESISLVVMRSQDRMIPALAFNREILRGLSHRLQFLSALSRKDLSENLRELLMISHKFQALAVLAFYYDSVVRDSQNL
jgi:hypothetical protein